MGHHFCPSAHTNIGKGSRPRAWQELHRVLPETWSIIVILPGQSNDELAEIITTEELLLTAQTIAQLQLPSGMIPWFPNGHCDPWNHVETAMALDIMGMHDHAQRAYSWLADIQRADGSWHNYYLPDGTLEDAKLDTNVCAYIATGIWHHYLITRDEAFVRVMWPTVKRALTWVLGMRKDDGTILWACETDSRPWDYSLLTGSSSIRHSLHCGANIGAVLGESQPEWRAAADTIDHLIGTDQSVFEPKLRWAMDWYYPVLTGATIGAEAKSRLSNQWDEFIIDGRGVRCVNDEDWVTAAETAECSLAHAAAGELDKAKELLSWTRAHRNADGSYFTGIVYPDRIVFPADERSAYTAAAVILAADAISQATPAWNIFLSSTVID